MFVVDHLVVVGSCNEAIAYAYGGDRSLAEWLTEILQHNLNDEQVSSQQPASIIFLWD